MAYVEPATSDLFNWSVMEGGRELRAFRSRVLADDCADRLNRRARVTVEYWDAETEWQECYRSMAEAAQVARLLVQWGGHPTIKADSFSIYPMTDRRTGKIEWAFSFQADGFFKSRACRVAEDAGVRYRSHRKGYRASDRAFRAFCAAWIG